MVIPAGYQTLFPSIAVFEQYDMFNTTAAKAGHLPLIAPFRYVALRAVRISETDVGGAEKKKDDSQVQLLATDGFFLADLPNQTKEVHRLLHLLALGDELTVSFPTVVTISFCPTL